MDAAKNLVLQILMQAVNGVSDVMTQVSESATEMGDEVSAANDEMSASSEKATEAIRASSEAIDESLAGVSASAATAATDTTAAMAKTAESTEASAAKTSASADATNKSLSSMGKGATIALAGIAIAIGLTVKVAGDYQAAMTRLVTSAGELPKNLQMVQQGVLQISEETGYSLGQLATDSQNAMYTIESGGQHGAAGLAVLKASAEGARTENASLVPVADAVTSAMTDYHYAASQAALVTSMLVAATGQGKTTFEQLAEALPQVLSKAAAAHIPLTEILGDLASMTLHGMSADQAAQNLAHTIGNFENPSQTMIHQLALLGLNATQLTQNLGSKGLYGTLEEITTAIDERMGKGSQAVIINMLDALKGLPPAVQASAQAMINGTESYEEWYKAAKNLTPLQRSLVQQFGTMYNSVHAIGNEQLSGAEAMQSYNGALAKAVGSSDALNVALMLTGQNSANTTRSIKAVSDATVEAGNNVKGWHLIQNNFNTKLAQMGATLIVIGEEIGQALLPTLTRLETVLLAVLRPLGEFIAAHPELAKNVLLVVAGIAALLAVVAGTTLAVEKLVSAYKFFTEESLVAKAAIAAMTIAQEGLDVAMDANPVGVLVLALAALAVMAYELITHWKQVTEFITAVFHPIMGLMRSDVGFVIAAFLPFIGLPLLIIARWQQLKSFFEGLMTDLDRVVGAISTVTKGFATGGAIGGFTAMLHTMHVPGFASGIQNFSGGLAVVGEQGPELAYLPSGSSVIPAPQTSAMLNGQGSGGINVTVNLTAPAINGTTAEARQFAYSVAQQIMSITKAAGSPVSFPGVRPI